MALIFVTGNRHKFKEVQKTAARHGLKIEMRDISCKEIQADELEDISACSVEEACEILGKPCFVEDAGLFVRALRGFPGPYSNYVFRTIGNEGLLKLMAGVKDRRAEFRSAVGYCEPKTTPRIFSGRVRGGVAPKPGGSHGFGFDPIFIPESGGGKTFAEMTTVEKNKYSHRAKAIGKFLKWHAQRKTV